MNLRLVTVSLLVALGFAGCATFSDSELAQIRHSGVSPTVATKFQQGRILTPPDIIEATRRGVPDDLIVRQIQDASVDYVLTRNDIKQLGAAHVSRAVMDALIAECNDWAGSHSPPGPAHTEIVFGGYPAYPYYDYPGTPYYYPYYYGYGGGAVIYGGRHYHHRWR